MNLTLTGYWNSVNTFKHAEALILKNQFLICEQNKYILNGLDVPYILTDQTW